MAWHQGEEDLADGEIQSDDGCDEDDVDVGVDVDGDERDERDWNRRLEVLAGWLAG